MAVRLHASGFDSRDCVPVLDTCRRTELSSREFNPRCFTMWLAGGGIKPGITLGETDDYCYNVTKDPVHVHDLQPTILHSLGIDHKRLTYKFQGRHFRLTDIAGNVVKSILI